MTEPDCPLTPINLNLYSSLDDTQSSCLAHHVPTNRSRRRNQPPNHRTLSPKTLLPLRGLPSVRHLFPVPYILLMIASLEDFHPSPSAPLPPHLQIYTWPSCTLRELAHLLTTALPTLLPDPAIGTRLSFRLIFPDTRDTGRPGPGRFLSKELGSIVIGGDGPGVVMPSSEEQKKIVASGQMGGALGGEPEKTLQDARFVIGDFVSCAVFPPLANGAVASGTGAMRDRDRENGMGSGFRVRGSGTGGGARGGFGGPGFPQGEWRRGEVPGRPR